MSRDSPPPPNEIVAVAAMIVIVRGKRVILDAQLAALYGTPTKRLNEQVRRNSDRFPIDFMFRLTPDETASLNWSQIATSSQKHRRTIFAPYAFSEHGAIMAANVLNTDEAIKMSVYVVRAFVQLRELLLSNKELALRLDQLEARLEKKLDTHDDAIAAMLSAIRELMVPTVAHRPGIGFTADIREKK
jgi:ORF6N domain